MPPFPSFNLPDSACTPVAFSIEVHGSVITHIPRYTPSGAPAPTEPSEIVACKKCKGSISSTQSTCPLCGSTSPHTESVEVRIPLLQLKLAPVIEVFQDLTPEGRLHPVGGRRRRHGQVIQKFLLINQRDMSAKTIHWIAEHFCNTKYHTHLASSVK
jgi:hypothetical protein